MEVVHNYIEKDMIRVNSTRPKYKPETAYEKWNKLSREKQEERIEYAKKAAIVFCPLETIRIVGFVMHDIN